MPLRWRTSPIVDLSSASPSRTAAPIGMPFLPSGVKKNIGRMKMKYQTADSGPVARASSPSFGSSPKIGSTPMIVLPVSGDAGHEGDDEDQHDHAAEIAEPPGDVGDPADLGLGDQARHHRIVEDGREFRRDRGQREEATTTQNRLEPGAANHSMQQADDLDRREEADPRLARAGLVGDRAEHRREDGDDEAGGGDAVAPGRLAHGRIARHARDEIGAEDEGRHDGEEWLRRPVEEHPAPDAAPAASSVRYRPRRLPFRCCRS